MTEAQLLRVRWVQIERTKGLLVTAGNASGGYVFSLKVKQLGSKREVCDTELHDLWQSVHVFFTAGTTKLTILTGLLDKWRSSAITQYGEVEKTRYRTAFGELGKERKVVYVVGF